MNVAQCLEALGLTPIEALAYAYLVAAPSVTGYRVARGIGKPTANVYRALEGLERKGAVTRDRSPVPLFRAVSPDELLNRLEQEFSRRRSAAARELASLHADESDERFYTVTDPDQLAGRARLMLAAARRVVLIDGPADVVDALHESVRDARDRGVRVVVIARGKATDAHPDTRSDTVARRGERPPLRMVADAREALMGLLSADGTRARDAMWTRSRLFATTLHEALTTECFYLQVGRDAIDGLSADEVERSYERCREIRGDSAG